MSLMSYCTACQNPLFYIIIIIGLLAIIISHSKFSHYVKRFWMPALFISAILFQLNGLTHDLDYDESISILLTDRGLDFTLSTFSFTEQNPPLYYIILWLWRQISHDIIWARLLSVVFYGIMLVYLKKLAEKMKADEFGAILLAMSSYLYSSILSTSAITA